MFSNKSLGKSYQMDDVDLSSDESGVVNSEGVGVVNSEGVRGSSNLKALSNTDTNTNSLVTDKSDDEEIVVKEISETMKDAIEVSRYLADSLKASIDNFKYPTEATIMKWAKDVDLAIRLDNRTLDGLKNLIGCIPTPDYN